MWRLLLGSLCVFISACNSSSDEADTADSNRVIQNPSTPSGNSDPAPTAASEPSETLTDALRIGKSTSLKLKFPGNHACIDSEKKVKWTLRSNLNRASLDHDDICEPTITTTADFEGDGDVSLIGDLMVRDNDADRLIRWNITRVELKNPPVILVNSLTRTRAQWLAASTNAAAVGGTGSLREVTYLGNPTTAQLVIGIDGRVVNQDGGAFFWEPANTRRVNREYLFNLNISDPDNEEERLIIEGKCGPEVSTSQLYTECPFEFDPVNPSQMQLRMRVKLDARALDPYFGGALSLKRVFFSGMSQHRVTDIWVEARHPDSSQIIRAELAKIIIYAYNWLG